MLAQFWRLRMINETGQTMTFNDGAAIAVRAQGWKIGASGAITYGTVITEDMGFGAGETIVDDGEVEGTVVDNSTNKFYGINGTFTVTHDLDAASGVCRLYLEFSDEDGNWPSDASDFVITDLIQIAVLNIDNSDVDKSRSCNFSFS
jgi:hypothetical protein